MRSEKFKRRFAIGQPPGSRACQALVSPEKALPRKTHLAFFRSVPTKVTNSVRLTRSAISLYGRSNANALTTNSSQAQTPVFLNGLRFRHVAPERWAADCIKPPDQEKMATAIRARRVPRFADPDRLAGMPYSALVT